MAKEEIAQNETFLLLPNCFQSYLIGKLSFIEIFYVFVNKFRIVVFGKGINTKSDPTVKGFLFDICLHALKTPKEGKLAHVKT